MPRRPSSEAPRPGDISPKLMVLVMDGIPLVFLGLLLSYSGPLFTMVTDEALVLNSAAQPLRAIWAQFRFGPSLHEPLPLYYLLLHLWLRLSGGAFLWLRAPSILFFLVGVWLLSRAAGRCGGAGSATTLLWLAVLWPYGFHHGRLAVWYSLSFLLVSGLTWAYLRFCASPNLQAWLVVCVFALSLVCVDYFGWFLLILLGIDDWLRNRKQQRPAGWRLLITAAVLAALYAPLWPAFLREMTRAVNLHSSLRLLVLNAGYDLYVMLASESVAPWFWHLGVPVVLAIAVCLVLVCLSLRPEVRRLLIFGGLLLVAMDLLGVLQTRQLLLVAPWFLLPIALALGSVENAYQRRALVVSLILISGIGWYGAYIRRYYAVADFQEPWPGLAADAAGAVHEGGTVISNSPQFFLYLTYALQGPPSALSAQFSGFLPDAVRQPEVWSVDGWEAAGHPVRPFMLWVRGNPASASAQQMDGAEELLDKYCGGRVNRYLVRDPAFSWRQRLFPANTATPWRIEIHQYDCHDEPAPATAPASPPSAR